MLQKLTTDDIQYSVPQEFGIENTTELTLSDYDWMTYSLEGKFLTKTGDYFVVCFSYMGTVQSDMTVDIGKPKQTPYEHHYYKYPTDIFEKHLKIFMQKHMQAWDEKFAFQGIDLILDFYNDVLEHGELVRFVNDKETVEEEK